ncbi:MAG TPA: peptide chain release factor N(5)-glutamine methyltransferase [Aeromicrobium sp.]|nr:peptide chain release factor N(5)-glutamine methyltransferase [Aeromicrobium sp.]
MSAAEMLASATAMLDAAGVASPDVDAELLLSHVTGVPRLKLRICAEPTPKQNREFAALVARRAAREPLQHLTGIAAFRYRELIVGPGVFIPRPETELLAGWAIAHLGGLEEPIVVDMCTGSGAIAAAIADEVRGAQVFAVELDESAFAYAQRNLAGTGVDVRQGDIADAFADLDGCVDVVVANPPYIPLGAWESVETEARDHDPSLALWSGDDGLDTIRVVEQAAFRLLKPGGVVGCEHADVQGESAPVVFLAANRWSEVRDNPDLGGRPRFVTAQRGL